MSPNNTEDLPPIPDTIKAIHKQIADIWTAGEAAYEKQSRAMYVAAFKTSDSTKSNGLSLMYYINEMYCDEKLMGKSIRQITWNTFITAASEGVQDMIARKDAVLEELAPTVEELAKNSLYPKVHKTIAGPSQLPEEDLQDVTPEARQTSTDTRTSNPIIKPAPTAGHTPTPSNSNAKNVTTEKANHVAVGRKQSGPGKGQVAVEIALRSHKNVDKRAGQNLTNLPAKSLVLIENLDDESEYSGKDGEGLPESNGDEADNENRKKQPPLRKGNNTKEVSAAPKRAKARGKNFPPQTAFKNPNPCYACISRGSVCYVESEKHAQEMLDDPTRACLTCQLKFKKSCLKSPGSMTMSDNLGPWAEHLQTHHDNDGKEIYPTPENLGDIFTMGYKVSTSGHTHTHAEIHNIRDSVLQLGKDISSDVVNVISQVDQKGDATRDEIKGLRDDIRLLLQMQSEQNQKVNAMWVKMFPSPSAHKYEGDSWPAGSAAAALPSKSSESHADYRVLSDTTTATLTRQRTDIPSRMSPHTASEAPSPMPCAAVLQETPSPMPTRARRSRGLQADSPPAGEASTMSGEEGPQEGRKVEKTSMKIEGRVTAGKRPRRASSVAKTMVKSANEPVTPPRATTKSGRGGKRTTRETETKAFKKATAATASPNALNNASEVIKGKRKASDALDEVQAVRKRINRSSTRS